MLSFNTKALVLYHTHKISFFILIAHHSLFEESAEMDVNFDGIVVTLNSDFVITNPLFHLRLRWMLISDANRCNETQPHNWTSSLRSFLALSWLQCFTGYTWKSSPTEPTVTSVDNSECVPELAVLQQRMSGKEGQRDAHDHSQDVPVLCDRYTVEATIVQIFFLC